MENPRLATRKLVTLGNQQKWPEAVQLLKTLAGPPGRLDVAGIAAAFCKVKLAVGVGADFFENAGCPPIVVLCDGRGI